MKDLTGDNHLTAQCAEWLEAKKQLLKWQKIEKSTKAHIINALNKHEVDDIKLGDFEVTAIHKKASKGKAITLEDVGKITGARAGSTTIKINEVPND